MRVRERESVCVREREREREKETYLSVLLTISSVVDLLHIDTAIVGRKHHPGKLLPLANTDNSSLRSNQLNSQRQSQMGSSLSAVDALISTDVSVNGVHKNVDESSAASLSSSSIPMPDPRAFNDSQAVPSASSQLRLERELV